MTATQDEKNAEIFEQVWLKATTRISDLIKDPAEEKFLKSIVMGGTVAAEAIVSSTAASEFWGEGNIAWADEISQLLSFLMLSQCYRWVTEKIDEGQSPLPKEVIVTRLIYAFGTEPEQSLDDFARFDAQFNHDLDTKPHIVHAASFILGRICEIAGHPCFAWGKIKFPVDELTSLAKKGVIIDSEPIRGQNDINVVTTSISMGLEAMNKFHDESS